MSAERIAEAEAAIAALKDQLAITHWPADRLQLADMIVAYQTIIKEYMEIDRNPER